MVNKVLVGTSFLVVDDDVSCVRMTSLILQAHGATVYEATSGEEALVKARAHGPAIILADLLMPEMDGWALVKSIKADPLLRSSPVIAVTASYLTPSDIDHALAVGFAKVLAKPLSIQILLEAISLAGAS
ncbi:MAG: response regulator [Chloroflexi bacterium]|nr:response regulator [Chloroflexota bacterium]